MSTVILTIPGGYAYNSPVQRIAYGLGLTSEVSITDAAPTWHRIGSTVQFDSALMTGVPVSAVLELRAFNAGIGVTARIVDDLGAVAGTSTIVTSQTFTSRVFSIVLSSGLRRYHVELLPSAANEDVFATGYLEVNR